MEKLEKYGVQEMNAVEMREVDGGFWPALLKAAEVVLVLIGVAEVINEFNYGWKSVKCAKK